MENLPPPNMVDVAALILIALGALQGYRRGLSGELARVIGVVAAFLCGLAFFRPLTDRLQAVSRLEGRPAQVVSFVILVLGALIVMLVLRYVLGAIMKVVIEEKFEKPGGVIAGVVRSALFVVLIFLVMNLWPHDYLNRVFGSESLIGTFFQRYGPSVEGSLKPE